jgi:hypothetical protein
MLPMIVDAIQDELEIFFDSGIRCGADIAKALALVKSVVWSEDLISTDLRWVERTASVTS